MLGVRVIGIWLVLGIGAEIAGEGANLLQTRGRLRCMCRLRCRHRLGSPVQSTPIYSSVHGQVITFLSPRAYTHQKRVLVLTLYILTIEKLSTQFLTRDCWKRSEAWDLATSYPPGLEIFCTFVFVAATLNGST